MNTLQKLIVSRITAEGNIHHDKITAALPHEDTAREIHALYMADIIGLRSDGILYRKY